MKRLLPLLLLAACTQPPRPCLEGSIISIESDALKDPLKVQALSQKDPWVADCTMEGEKASVQFSPGALQRLIDSCEYNASR